MHKRGRTTEVYTAILVGGMQCWTADVCVEGGRERERERETERQRERAVSNTQLTLPTTAEV